MRIDRMLSIVVTLLGQDKITAPELAKKFEVSVRTVYRDIEAINQAGIPVVSYPGNNGGYGIMENYKLDRQVLTLDDMLSILSALKGINIAFDNRELDTAIDKISSLVPKEKSGQMELRFEQVVFDLMPWGYRKRQKECIKSVYNAIVHSHPIRFLYRNYIGETQERTVEPLTLIFKGYAWYLFAYCRLREDFRLFRLSRIRELEELDENFVRRDQSYQDFIEPDLGQVKMTDLVLRFSPKVRVKVEDYFDEEEITIEENGDLIVRASLIEDEWIYDLLLSYGEYVEVLEPPHMRKAIEKKVEKILKMYQ